MTKTKAMLLSFPLLTMNEKYFLKVFFFFLFKNILKYFFNINLLKSLKDIEKLLI